jgi:hypothetical protein
MDVNERVDPGSEHSDNGNDAAYLCDGPEPPAAPRGPQAATRPRSLPISLGS